MKLNFTYKKGLSLILLLFIFGFSNKTGAASYFIKTALTGDAVSPLDWNTTSNWAIGSASGTEATALPTSSDTVTISDGKYVLIGTSAVCSILTVAGTTANLYIGGTATLNCTTININTGGNITMIALAPSTNILTCTGVLNVGTPLNSLAAGKGTLTVSNGSAVSCGRLTLGAGLSTNASTIPGRTGSSTFTFTGNGATVIPAITTGVNATTPVFATVIFDPGAGNTITIPSGFCALAMNIQSGTVDFGANYSAIFTETSGSLNMEALTTLKIGGTKQIPNMATYLFNDSSTINFYGTIQSIRGIAAGYKNLTISGTGLKSLQDDVKVKLTLSIGNGTILDLANHNLTISGNYVNGTYVGNVYTKGTGKIRSSDQSDIWYRGYSSSKMQFDQTTPGTTNVVKKLTLGDVPTAIGATVPTLINPLDLTIENDLIVTESVNFTAGHLVSNGNVTFKSTGPTALDNTIISQTAFVGPITDLTYCGIIGDVKIERYIPAGNRAYRPLSSSVTGTNIFANWQENGSIGTVQGTITGTTLTTTTAITNLAAGMHISGAGIPAHTTITSKDDTTNYTISSSAEIPTAQTIYFNGAPSGFGTHITGIASSDALLGSCDSNNTGLDYTRSGNPSMYSYNNNNNTIGWVKVSNTKTETLTAGKPYLLMIRGDRTVDLALNSSATTATTLRSTGTIVAGPITIPTADLSHLTGLNTTLDSFNYVGNPYQAPVDLSLIYADNTRWVDLGTSYTVFDPTVSTRGAYVTYDFALDINTSAAIGTGDNAYGSSATSKIQPNQAFFVTTKGASPTLVFNEADKDITSNVVNMFRKAQTKNTNSLIRGAIFNSVEPTKVLDGFIVAFSDDYDNAIVAEDTKKPTGNSDETISSKNGVSSMAIDKRNFPALNDEISLNISQYRSTDYTLKFNVTNFDAQDAVLVDTYIAKETPLTNNQVNAYNFTVDTSIPASTATNRFKIVFKTATTALSTASNTISEFTVFPNPVTENKFTIKASQNFNGKKAAISIVNTLGQNVYTTNTTFSSDASIAVNPTTKLNQGVYVLKVTVDGKVETEKLIIK